MLPAPSLQNHSIPPRITEKSCRLRVSNRTMVGVLEPSRVACVASGPKASNHRVMKPSNRYRRLPWSVKSMSRTQSLSRSQIGLDANRHIHLLSERTEGIFFLDIPSHRTHPALLLFELKIGPRKRTSIPVCAAAFVDRLAHSQLGWCGCQRQRWGQRARSEHLVTSTTSVVHLRAIRS